MLHQEHRGEQQPRLLGDLELAHLGVCRGGGEREREGNDQPLPANHERPPRTNACGARAHRHNGIGTAAAQAPWGEDDGRRLVAGGQPDLAGETLRREAGRSPRSASPGLPRGRLQNAAGRCRALGRRGRRLEGRSHLARGAEAVRDRRAGLRPRVQGKRVPKPRTPEGHRLPAPDAGVGVRIHLQREPAGAHGAILASGRIGRRRCRLPGHRDHQSEVQAARPSTTFRSWWPTSAATVPRCWVRHAGIGASSISSRMRLACRSTAYFASKGAVRWSWATR